MTKEVNGIIILDNNVSVLPVFENYCSKCKKNLSPGNKCYQCFNFPYELVINLGYYYSRWYKMDDKYISPELDWSFNLDDINLKYRFSKLINDAKQRCRYNTIPERIEIIKILSNGFTWKMRQKFTWILNEIDFIVHVPKKEEDPSRDKNNSRYLPSGYIFSISS